MHYDDIIIIDYTRAINEFRANYSRTARNLVSTFIRFTRFYKSKGVESHILQDFKRILNIFITLIHKKLSFLNENKF